MRTMIQNYRLCLTASSKGAELQSLKSSINGLEYLWQADPRVWAQHSPILFPVVARQQNDCHRWKGRDYTMPMHGFAHAEEFEVCGIGSDWVRYVLRESARTLAMYPFAFSLTVGYRLDKNVVEVTYTVKNKGEEPMPYSIGGHTGYRVPLLPNERYADYELCFECAETAPIYPIRDYKLAAPEPYLERQRILPLTGNLFGEGALVFRDLRSREVALRASYAKKGISVRFDGFDTLAIWGMPGADFVCIEPWNGLPSSPGEGPALNDKSGIRILAPGKEHSFRHIITVD